VHLNFYLFICFGARDVLYVPFIFVFQKYFKKIKKIYFKLIFFSIFRYFDILILKIIFKK